VPSGTLIAAAVAARLLLDSTTRQATRAAANPAKWKCATVSDSTVRLKPNSSYDERSATSARAAIAGVTSAV
jgi:hypothetical protein